MNVNEFLGFYFPAVNDPASKEVVAIGGDKANNTVWVARPWRPAKLNLPVGRLYFCISTVNPPANARVNRVPKGAHDLVKTYVVGLDDIKDGHYADKKTGQRTRIPLPPTTVLETSAGNTQWLYRLKYGADPARAAALIEAITAAGMGDPGAKRADRYLRVPGSLNTKYDPPFVARVLEHHPERAWSLAELEVAIGVTSTEVRALNEEAVPLKPGEIDPTWDLVQACSGMVKGPIDARGWVPVVCPNEAQHTPGKGQDGGTHYFPKAGGGHFKCLHAHCVDFETPELREWLFNQEVPDLGAFGAELGTAITAARAAPAEEGEEAVRFRAAAAEGDAAMRKYMIDHYIHVELEDRYWSVKAHVLVKKGSVDDSMTSTMKNTSLLHVYSAKTGDRTKDMSVQAWLRQQRDLRRVTGTTHRLGQPLIVEGRLNMAPLVPEPIEDLGDPLPWLDLVDTVLPNRREAEYWLDWAAMTVTAWDEKPGWVPMLKGIPGAGKGMILNPIKRYLDGGHWIMIQPQEMQGQFTYYAKKRLVIIEELKQITHGSLHMLDIYTLMKKFTGRGNRMVSIRDLGLEPYEALDLSAWSIFSNEHSPMPLEKGERRIGVFKTAPPRDNAYYLAIGKWIDDGGWRVVIGWLQERWRSMTEEQREGVRGNAPMTDAKQEIIDVSGGTLLGSAVRLCVSGRYGAAWPDLMTMGDIVNALSSSGLLSQADISRSLGELVVARALRDEGAIQLFDGKQVEYPAGCRIRLWCVRGEKSKAYEKLGQGKRMVETYQAMKSVGAAPTASNVTFLRPK